MEILYSLIVKAVNDTAIGIALLYLNHACHYHDVFAYLRASSHTFLTMSKL